MKKIMCVALIIVSTFLSSLSFAKGEITSITAPAGSSTAVCDSFPTCINVINYSSSYIYVDIPDMGISTSLDAGMMQSNAGYDYYNQRVILSDWLGFRFYDEYVPNHFMLYVYDFKGKYKVSPFKI